MKSHENMLCEINGKLDEVRSRLTDVDGDPQNYEWSRQELMSLIYQYQDRLDFNDKVELVGEVERLLDHGVSPSFEYHALDMRRGDYWLLG